MICIVSRDPDGLARRVLDALHDRGIAAVRVDEADLLGALGLAPVAGAGRRARGPAGLPVPLWSAASTVLSRIPPPPAGRPPAGARREAAVRSFLAGLPGHVVNRASVLGDGAPLALDAGAGTRLREAGLALAPIAPAEGQDRAHALLAGLGGAALVRAPSGAVIGIAAGSAGERRLAETAGRHPVLLQALPAGRWVRAFVAGEHVVAASGPVAALADEGELWTAALPGALRAQCRALARALDLELAQIDLILGERDRATCLDARGFLDDERCPPALQERLAYAVATCLEPAAAPPLREASAPAGGPRAR